MIGNVINFLITYNESIIQWLILAIVLISAYLLGLMLFGKKKEETSAETKASSDLDSNQLKQTLTEILAQAKTGLSTPAATAASTGGVSVETQTLLQKELDDSKAKMAELKVALEKAQAQPTDTTNYLEKIKELEGKLAEYEILEDDIADLSVFKEENLKLKAELEKLKLGAGGVAGGASSSDGETIIKEFAETIEKTKEAVPAKAAAVAPVADELVNEFANALDEQKTSESEEKTEEAEEASADPIGDDILAEFAASLEENASAPVKKSEDFDTDKMLAEMADLEAMGESPDGSALDEAIDTDKMASEASNLSSKN